MDIFNKIIIARRTQTSEDVEKLVYISPLLMSLCNLLKALFYKTFASCKSHQEAFWFGWFLTAAQGV